MHIAFYILIGFLPTQKIATDKIVEYLNFEKFRLFFHNNEPTFKLLCNSPSSLDKNIGLT